jgi:hypothetical protein
MGIGAHRNGMAGKGVCGNLPSDQGSRPQRWTQSRFAPRAYGERRLGRLGMASGSWPPTGAGDSRGIWCDRSGVDRKWGRMPMTGAHVEDAGQTGVLRRYQRADWPLCRPVEQGAVIRRQARAALSAVAGRTIAVRMHFHVQGTSIRPMNDLIEGKVPAKIRRCRNSLPLEHGRLAIRSHRRANDSSADRRVRPNRSRCSGTQTESREMWKPAETSSF